MAITLHWFLPATGDGRGQRPPTVGHLTQVARATERLGFAGAMTPASLHSEDALATTLALSGASGRLRFLVALRPGLVSPTLAARQAATYHRLTGGRLLLHVVTGEQPSDQRYDRMSEFLNGLRGSWSVRPPEPVPTIYLGGTSPAAEAMAAWHAGVYLLRDEAPALLAERVDRMRLLAGTVGRKLRFAMRLHVITRDTEADALAETRRPPNRGSADAALVGSHEQVADRIEEYYQLGVDELILSGRPCLEEARWFGENVTPILRRRGLTNVRVQRPALVVVG